MTRIKAGTPLRWTQRHPFTNEIVRVVESVAYGEPFEINREGSISREVVRLNSNRLARVEDCEIIGSVTEVQQPEESKTNAPQKTIASQSDGNRKGQSDSATVRRQPGRSGVQPAGHHPTTAGACGSAQPVDVQSGQGKWVVEVLAIDFMNLLVRAFHAGKPTETHAVRSMFQTIANAVRQLRPERIVFALDGGHVHRTALLPTYKAHRPPSDPLLVAQRELAEKALIAAGFQSVRVMNFEADDVIASIATANRGTVICSCDKDLLALGGIARVFHPWGAGEFMTAESKLGLPPGQVTDYLALCGDSSDGIPGVKGIGPKTALELLTEFDSLEGILTAATLGKIKGAKGITLKEQRAEALKSRQIVELRTSLPLPELRPWHPPTGFQQTLQSMGLGSVAAILETLLSLPPLEETPSPATTPKSVTGSAKPKSLFDDDTEEHPKSAVSALSAGTGQPERAKAESVDRAQSDNECGSESEKLDRPVTSTEAADSQGSLPAASGIASQVREFNMGIECLMVLEKNVCWETREASAVTCWHAGREHRDRGVENPWKRDSFQYLAWSQGFQGVPLCVDL